jgi:hypothetical protein
MILLSLQLTACGDPAQDNSPSVDLTDAVYADEDVDGKWATFAFIDEDTVYYFPDNAVCYNGTYAYTGSSAGLIAPVKTQTGETGAAPGAFTISMDKKTIIFTNYLGTQGERSFKRVRDTDAVDEEEIPFTYTALDAASNLDGTVWAGTALRTKDWTTLTITAVDAASGTIQVSHSFDCTSNPRAYSDYAYNTETDLVYIGPFRIEGSNFTFLNFYGHGGEITLKRMR